MFPVLGCFSDRICLWLLAKLMSFSSWRSHDNTHCRYFFIFCTLFLIAIIVIIRMIYNINMLINFHQTVCYINTLIILLSSFSEPCGDRPFYFFWHEVQIHPICILFSTRLFAKLCIIQSMETLWWNMLQLSFVFLTLWTLHFFLSWSCELHQGPHVGMPVFYWLFNLVIWFLRSWICSLAQT